MDLTASDRERTCGEYGALRLIAGGLLLFAAIAKAVAPWESAMLLRESGIPSLAVIAVIQAELLLGCALLLNYRPRAALACAALTFSAFACVALFLAVRGASSCGCFGSAPIHPWAMFALDVAIACCLTWAARRTDDRAEERRRWVSSGQYSALVLTLGVPLLAITFLNLRPLLGDSASGTFDAGDVVLLEPENWVGKPFPLSSHIEPSIDVRQGRWTVVLIHHDCPDCIAALQNYTALTESPKFDASGMRVVFVELAPYGNRILPRGEVEVRRLSQRNGWIVRTPVAIQLVDGKVNAISRQEQSVTDAASFLNL